MKTRIVLALVTPPLVIAGWFLVLVVDVYRDRSDRDRRSEWS